MDNSSSTVKQQIDPKLLAVAAPEIKRRVEKMLEAGKRPQALFLAVSTTSNGLVSFKTTNPDRTVLPIFTSGHTAMDYLKTAKVSGGVHMFPIESLPPYVEQWRRMRIDSFVLDRCPRCPDFLCLPIDVHTEQQFLTLWAAHRATRDFQAERLINAFLDALKNPGAIASSSAPGARNLLETLRDHIDYSVCAICPLVDRPPCGDRWRQGSSNRFNPESRSLRSGLHRQSSIRRTVRTGKLGKIRRRGTDGTSCNL
jgi:hypothetical protein